MKKKLSELNKEELINLCRYYRGQDANPYEGRGGNPNKAALWFYEMSWVNMMLNDNERNGNGTLAEYLNEYTKAGLKEFRKNDVIPTTLKALLFNRFMRDSMDGNAEPFKEFYNQYY